MDREMISRDLSEIHGMMHEIQKDVLKSHVNLVTICLHPMRLVHINVETPLTPGSLYGCTSGPYQGLV